MPGLTYERARGVHLDPSFNASYSGEVYAQSLLWREPRGREVLRLFVLNAPARRLRLLRG
jgi:hypothetical protein